jgi:outer membrane protein assembly factor BamB
MVDSHTVFGSLGRMVLFLALLASFGAVQASEPPKLEPIAEVTPERLNQPYRRVVMNLEGAVPERKGLQITLGVLGDEVVQIWALTPVWGSQRLISRTGSLQVQGGRIAGTCYVLVANPFVDKLHYKSCKGGGAWWQFQIQVAVGGQRVTGSYVAQRSNPNRKDKDTHKGSIAGYAVDRQAFEKLHPLAKSDYACWRGAIGNGTAPETGWELVEQLADAEVLWASEEWELPGTYNIVMGGLGGPIVSDGLVYLSYQMPNGPTFDEEWYKKIMPNGPEEQERISYYGHLAGDYGAKWLRRRTSIEADDIVLCVDAQTGLTVWKRVFPAAARNPSYSNRSWSWAKNGPYTTPCAADGKLFTIGGHGAIYCLDARTGKTVWTGGLPSSKNARDHLAEAVSQGRMVQRTKRKPRAPDYVVSVCYAEGVIVATDNGYSVMGLDARTGKQLWGGVKIDGLGHGRGGGAHSGVPMPIGNRTLVVMGPAVMDPRTGKVLWSVDAKYFRGELGNAAVSGDVIVFGNGIKNKESDRGLSAWRFNGSTAQLLWEKDDNYCQAGFATPTIYKDHLYIATRPKNGNSEGAVLCVELKTGKIVGSVDRVRGEGNIAQLLAGDGRMLVGQQGGSWWRTDPQNFARLCEFPGGDSVPNNQSSHPQAMCGGRLYSRGDFNLVCWDLRKKRDQTPPPLLAGSDEEQRPSLFSAAPQASSQPKASTAKEATVKQPAADGRADVLKALVAAVDQGQKPSFFMPSMRTRVRVIDADEDGSMKLSARGLRLEYDYARLSPAALRDLEASLRR